MKEARHDRRISTREPETIRILQVEGNIVDAKFAMETIRRTGRSTITIRNLALLSEAEKIVQHEAFDIILLTLSLPDSSGIESINRMQVSAPYIPIIVISENTNEEKAIEAVEQGAQDYLIKGQYSSDLILRTIRYAIERKKTSEKLKFISTNDELTGLPNRAYFLDYLDGELAQSKQSNDTVICLFLDLDRFKSINDIFGHVIGDELIKKVAERLNRCVRKNDFVARLGGDEFAIVMTQKKISMSVPRRVALSIIEQFKPPFSLADRHAHITVSIGVSKSTAGKFDAITLIKQADIAMYQAKEIGRNNFQLFNQESGEKVQLRSTLRESVASALDKNQFYLHYQPQMDIDSNKLIGLEALLRWRHPEKGNIGPDYFIPLLEESGFITGVGEWVLHTACRQHNEWIEMGLMDKHCRVAVNISPRQLRDNHLCQQVQLALQGSGLDPQCLDIELTESMLVDDITHTIKQLDSLHQMGVRITIDDFGTGYSSMRYLTKLPLDCLKIDRSFLQELLTSQSDAEVTEAIISLAHTLKLDVVAEGVDEPDKLAFLQKLQCDMYQGFLYSRPLTPSSILHLLKVRKKLSEHLSSLALVSQSGEFQESYKKAVSPAKGALAKSTKEFAADKASDRESLRPNGTHGLS